MLPRSVLGRLKKNQKCWLDGRIWVTTKIPITIEEKGWGNTWEPLLNPMNHPKEIQEKIFS